MRTNPENVQEAVLAVELVKKQSVYGYSGEDLVNFIKITVPLPRLIASCKRLLEKEIVYPQFHHEYRSYESNIDFDIR